MKKFKFLLAAAVAFCTLLTFNSCDLLFNLIGNVDNSGSGNNEQKINYTFKLTDDKVGYAYYTSEDKFSYTSPATGEKKENCCYQISFARKTSTSGSWTLYTRPVDSTKTIETLGKGTYKDCDPAAEGTMVLTDNDGRISQSLRITKNTEGKYVFTADVTQLNKAINANGEK